MLQVTVTLTIETDGPEVVAFVSGDTQGDYDMVGVSYDDFEACGFYAFLYLIGQALLGLFQGPITREVFSE